MNEEILDAFMPMFKQMKKAFEDVLDERFDQQELDSIFLNARAHFSVARKRLPRISPASPWLKNIVAIAYEIGIWKELRQRGLSLHDISLASQKALVIFSKNTVPVDNINIIKKTLCSVSYNEAIANDSKQMAFSDDWIIECVLPTEQDQFDIGINVHRCPIATLCQRLDAEAFFPFLCVNGYVAHGLFGISLLRTQTLSHGAPFCDFRLASLDEPVETIITVPEHLSEFKNEVCQ